MADQIVCDTCASAIGRDEEGWHVRLVCMTLTRDGQKKPTLFLKANVCRRCARERTVGEIGCIISPAFEDRLRQAMAHRRARAGWERRS